MKTLFLQHQRAQVVARRIHAVRRDGFDAPGHRLRQAAFIGADPRQEAQGLCVRWWRCDKAFGDHLGRRVLVPRVEGLRLLQRCAKRGYFRHGCGWRYDCGSRRRRGGHRGEGHRPRRGGEGARLPVEYRGFEMLGREEVVAHQGKFGGGDDEPAIFHERRGKSPKHVARNAGLEIHEHIAAQEHIDVACAIEKGREVISREVEIVEAHEGAELGAYGEILSRSGGEKAGVVPGRVAAKGPGAIHPGSGFGETGEIDVRGQQRNVPPVQIGNEAMEHDGQGIGLFPRATPGAPEAQAHPARPPLFDQRRKQLAFKMAKQRRVPKEIGLAGGQVRREGVEFIAGQIGLPNPFGALQRILEAEFRCRQFDAALQIPPSRLRKVQADSRCKKIGDLGEGIIGKERRHGAYSAKAPFRCSSSSRDRKRSRS